MMSTARENKENPRPRAVLSGPPDQGMAESQATNPFSDKVSAMSPVQIVSDLTVMDHLSYRAHR
jgi:hypothetical protein